jgi:hypothetical protein
LLNNGRLLWAEAVYGMTGEEVRKEFLDPTMKTFSDPKLKAVNKERLLRLLFGKRSVLAYVEPPETESVPVETAEAPSTPTPKTKTDTLMATEGETIASEPILPNQPAQANKLSAVDAAARLLAESGQAMTCTELIASMAAKGYWRSPKGRTPAGTLYSAVLREIQTKGDKARFRKTARGQFALRETE